MRRLRNGVAMVLGALGACAAVSCAGAGSDEALGFAASACNLGFHLNRSLIRDLNRDFKPSGYAATTGMWDGTGSGVDFSLDWSGNEADVAMLNLRTPAGTISLPYTDPHVRFGGTNFNFAENEPLVFESADATASINIRSWPVSNASVRFAGTGFKVKIPNGPMVEIDITAMPSPDGDPAFSLSAKAAGQPLTLDNEGTWAWTASVP